MLGPTFARMWSRTAIVVPTGTVLFITMTFVFWLGPSSFSISAMSSAAANTYLRSVCPCSPVGVPTQMKIISASRYAAFLSSVYLSRPALSLWAIISSRPGS